jgi:hypothetical protein
MDSGLGLGWLRERALAKRRVCHGLLDGLEGSRFFVFRLSFGRPGGRPWRPIVNRRSKGLLIEVSLTNGESATRDSSRIGVICHN